jgi:bacterioferritin
MDKASQIVAELKTAYATQMRIIQNCLADAIDVDGAETLQELLDQGAQTALGHARRIAKRIGALEGQVPRTVELSKSRDDQQPSFNPRDLDSILRDAVKTTAGAIAQYERIIQLCDGHDFVTMDLIIELLVAERDYRQRLTTFSNKNN